MYIIHLQYDKNIL